MLVHLPNSISRNARNISCSSVVRSHSSREQAQSWVGSPNFIIGGLSLVEGERGERGEKGVDEGVVQLPQILRAWFMTVVDKNRLASSWVTD